VRISITVDTRFIEAIRKIPPDTVKLADHSDMPVLPVSQSRDILIVTSRSHMYSDEFYFV